MMLEVALTHDVSMSLNPTVLEYLLKYPSEEELFREYFQRIEAPFTELITLS